jgi:uncharacterized protein (TIGR03032 family)
VGNSSRADFDAAFAALARRANFTCSTAARAEFATVDLASGNFEPICFCPGYARGLAMLGRFAVIGLSTCRENRTFSGLALDQALAAKNVAPAAADDRRSAQRRRRAFADRSKASSANFYDVAVLPGAAMPSALGFKTEEIRRTIVIEE